MLRKHNPSLAILLLLGLTVTARAQEAPAIRPTPRTASPGGLGFDLFGTAGVNRPEARDSFEAVGLRANPIDFGGGIRLTGLRSGIFLQVSGAHWAETGERVFIDSDGTTFPLGIPLDVKTTFIDGTLGVKRALGNGRTPSLVYVGGGAGVVRYSESSPFSESGDDLDLTKLAYHALAGVEIPIVRRLAAVVDAKYRFVPALLGDGGVSAVLGEHSVGGLQAAVGLRIGFGGGGTVRPDAPATPAKVAPATPIPDVQPPVSRPSETVIVERAPVYLLPDAGRTPLKTLEAGTRITILEQKGDWVQIEFRDPQFGRRVGFVQKRFVRQPNE